MDFESSPWRKHNNLREKNEEISGNVEWKCPGMLRVEGNFSEGLLEHVRLYR